MSTKPARMQSHGTRWFMIAAVGLWIGLMYRSFVQLSAFRAFALTVVSLCLEALPFLVLGSIAAAAVHVFVPAHRLTVFSARLGPFGVPVAALSGLVAPVCECAIVPTVRGLRARGLPLPIAITVLVSVPLLNPVVFVATLAAFPSRPDLVAARFVGGLTVAVVTGFLFYAFSDRTSNGADPATKTSDASPPQIRTYDHPGHIHGPLHRPAAAGSRLTELVEHASAEFLEVSKYFVVGVLLSSLLQVAVPARVFGAVGTSTLLASLAMIGLAFMLSVCSEADAFVGKAFLPLLPAPAIVAFLVFGPMMDLKNAAMLRRVLSTRQLVLLAGTLVVLVTSLAMTVDVLWGGS